MSTHYKHGDHVPTAVLAKRLDELSDVIGQPGEERDRELTRRIPAELDRDADLVLSEAAQRMLKMEAERDALAAHVERMRDVWQRLHLKSPSPVEVLQAYSYVMRETPTTSLARLKAQWQAEALGHVLAEVLTAVEADTVRAHLRNAMRKLRRQAEGGEA